MDTLTEVAKNSNANSTVLVVVVIAIVLIIISIPIYKTMVKAQEMKRKQYMERDNLIVNVVKENATAITKLCVVLERSDKSCGDCKKEQLAHFERMHQSDAEVLANIKIIVENGIERRS